MLQDVGKSNNLEYKVQQNVNILSVREEISRRLLVASTFSPFSVQNTVLNCTLHL